MRKTYPDKCGRCGRDIADDEVATFLKGLGFKVVEGKRQPIAAWYEHWSKLSKGALTCYECAKEDAPVPPTKDNNSDGFAATRLRFYEGDMRMYERGVDAMEHPTPCEGCGRPLGFSFSTIRHVCSARCAEKAKRGSLLAVRKCAHCGEEYMPKRKDAKYCSTRCRVAAHRATGE